MAATPGDPLSVHSVQEEYFYLMVHPCACGGAWVSSDLETAHTDEGLVHRVKGRCARCGTERVFRFALSLQARTGPVREINPTDRPSRAVDAAEWMDLGRFYLERIERLKDPAERAQSLLDARQCIEEALKFYGPADEPPPAALWSQASRTKVANRPDAYRRSALEAMLRKIPPMERLRKVDAPAQREFRKALKQEARRRVARRWWQFWKRA